MGRILWTCVLVLLFAACGSDTPDREERGAQDPAVRLVKVEAGRVQASDVTDGQVEDLVRGNNEFAFGMYGAAAGEAGNDEGNLIFSPYSISLAFSMAYAGARGGTEDQMAETLNFLPQEGQHPAFNVLDRRVSEYEREEGNSGAPFQLNVANAIWGQRGYSFEEAYLDTLARHYGAGLQTVDFGQGRPRTRSTAGSRGRRRAASRSSYRRAPSPRIRVWPWPTRSTSKAPDRTSSRSPKRKTDRSRSLMETG